MEDIIKNTIDIFDVNAELYQSQYMNVDLYADTLDIFCEQLHKMESAILEVGCGPANVTKYLVKKRPDLKILATDLSEKMLELAKKNISNVEFKKLDFRDIESLSKKFDGMVCAFCVPYLSKNELEEFVSNSSEIIKENGVLYISTMEDENEKSEFKKASNGKGKSLYINYYTADYLIGILEKNDFKITELKRKIYRDKNENKVTDLIIIAKKTLHNKVQW